jgi:hypothetical protein
MNASRTDPFVRFLEAAPIDAEPITAEEDAAIAEVEADRSCGRRAEQSVRRDQARLLS